MEAALARATDPAGEGSRVFNFLDADSARLAAEAIDAASSDLSPIAGIAAGAPSSNVPSRPFLPAAPQFARESFHR